MTMNPRAGPASKQPMRSCLALWLALPVALGGCGGLASLAAMPRCEDYRPVDDAWADCMNQCMACGAQEHGVCRATCQGTGARLAARR